MKKYALFLFFFISQSVLSQFITVDTNTYTVPQLVNNILINSTCINANNITWRTGTNFGSSNGIGFFQNTNPNFPMQSGVILSTGNVLEAPGPKTTTQSNGSNAWVGDAVLESTLAASGIAMVSKNATVLEFEFVPISSHFDFDFLFASEEYGNFQCSFSDSFAFLLTNMTTGVTTNLAVVPGTTDPISVVTIRDNQFNTLCNSQNQQYFGSFNGSSSAATSAINFNGQTKLMNASAILTPNVTYKIKLVIADGGNNPQYDSAIFLSSNSFNIGQEVLGNDLTIANNSAICSGLTQVLNTGLSASQYTFTWKKDGVVISSANGPTLNVTQPGTYEVTYVNTSSPCQTYTDPIVVEFLPTFTTIDPQDLRVCNTGQASYAFDLTKNTTTINLGVNPPFEVSYHHTLADANNNVNPLNTTYNSLGNETVYVRIKIPGGQCAIVKNFKLLLVNQPIATHPNDYKVCSNGDSQTTGTFSLNSLNSEVLNGQSAGIYGVYYYPTLNDANAGTNQISSDISTTSTTIYIKVAVFGNASCSSITTVNLIVIPTPPVDTFEKVITCTDYTLPALTNGNYFTGPNGTGTPLFAGHIITSSQVLYIYNNTSALCPNASQFEIVIIKPDELAITPDTYCDSYLLPILEQGQGEYHTLPSGGGTVIPSGTLITTSQTVYFYFESTTPVPCIVDPPGFNINIQQSLNYDALPNGYFDCTSYTVQPLSFGDYYDAPNGTGNIIPPGTVLTSSQTMYAYGISGICPASKTINVVIGTSSFPTNLNTCVSYTLPSLLVGNYYSDLNHTTIIPDGTVINSNQTIYIYAPSQTDSNCIDNYSFKITITLPSIVPPVVTSGCGNYTLPSIPVGDYYTGPGGTGSLLTANTVLYFSQTIYIYQKDLVTGCTNEIPLAITVNIPPNIDSRSNIDVCNSTTYILPPLTIGEYRTQPNGGGTVLAFGTIITTPQTIYIYAIDNNVSPPCEANGSFKIDFLTIQADAPNNVETCDTYTLPQLNVGDYYTGSNGTGTMMHQGEIITNTTTLYVYAVGIRATCTDEHSFTITINHTPIISPPINIQTCNSYFLPALTVGDYYTGNQKTGTILHAGDEIKVSQTIYIYAETNTTPNCWDEKSFTVDIYNVDELQSVTKCSTENYILPPLTVGNYYNGSNGTLGTIPVGTIISATKQIYIFGHSGYSVDCTDETTFTVTIINAPIANLPTISETTTCDIDGTNDGIFSFNLTQLNPTILGTQTSSDFNIKYYKDLNDANNQINSFTTTTLSNVLVRVNNVLTPNCFDIKPITLKVNKIPEPTPKNGIVCINSSTGALLNPYLIKTDLLTGNYTYNWTNSLNQNIGSNSTYLATLPGNYSVTVTDNTTGCVSQKKTVTVDASEPAIVSYVQNEEFTDNSTITVIATGTGGIYEYQLDEGVYQDSQIFENVLSGIHTITVRDKNGCGITSTNALVINYPKYFTPNGDGYNETWNISDLRKQIESTIFIYDRYGKLITEIKPSDIGWDGKYNDQQLPSDDYWFVLNYSKNGENKIFKSHFSLKR